MKVKLCRAMLAITTIISVAVVALECFVSGAIAQGARGPQDRDEDPVEIVPSVSTSSSHRVDLTPDGRFVAVATGNGATLWDVEKGRLVRTFAGLKSLAYSVAISRDGRYVAAGDSRGTIGIWNVRTGRAAAIFEAGLHQVYSVAFSSDGRRLIYAGDAISGKKTVLVIRDIDSSRTVKTVDGGLGVNAMDISPDGQIIAAGHWPEGTIRLLDSDGRLVRVITAHKSASSVSSVHALAFSPDGRLLASGGNDRSAKIWEVATGKLLLTLPGHDGHLDAVYGVVWSPDGTRLATVDSKRLRVWNARTGNLEKSASYDTKTPTNYDATTPMYLTSVAYLPDGNSLLLNGATRVDARTLERIGKFGVIASSEIVRGPASDTAVMIASSYPRRLSLLNVSTGSIRQLFKDPDALSSWWNVVGSRDGDRIAGVERNRSLVYLDLGSTNSLRFLQTDMNNAGPVAISPDGRFVAAANSGNILLLDPKDGSVVHSLRGEKDSGIQTHARRLEFSPDGRSLVSAWTYGALRVWQPASGRSSSAKLPAAADRFSFAPDGRSFLAVGTRFDQYTVDLFSIDGLRPLKRLQLHGHKDLVYAADFHPDGDKAVIGGFDSLLRLWNMNDARVVREYRGHTAPIDGVVLALSGQRIVSNGNDGLRIWDTATGALLVSYILTADGEWIAITPEGFFDASERGAEALSIVRGLELYSIDQFYDALHRPDLVHEKLAGDPQGKVREAAAKLDLSKAVASGSAPRVAITSPATGSSTQTERVTIEATVTDQGGGIGKLEWRINGVTLGLEERGLGRVGDPASDASQRPSIRISRTLSLEEGNNRIEVVAYNAQGLIASGPAAITVRLEEAQSAVPPQLYVLAVGINDYWDSRLRLSYAVPDAKAFGEALRQAGADLYSGVDVITVADGEATSANLDKVFSDLGKKIRPRDVFVLFVAGHGKTVDGRYYFLPQDFRYDGAESFVKKGVNQEQFQKWLARIEARKSLLFYDTCESGSLTGDRIAQRGVERVTALDHLTKAMGRTVLSAASDDAPALEGYRGHGIFTYVLLDGFGSADRNGNGLIEVNELVDYVEEKVPDLSYAAFKLRQVPTKNLQGNNFPLARKVAVLPATGEATADVIPAKPTHVVIAPVVVRQSANDKAPQVIELRPGTQVRLIETAGGWVLIARDGKRLGFVEHNALVDLQ
jgi:WD40 repeat protein/uncharacterized caspase-like protein